MARSAGAVGERGRHSAPERCIALGGKGAPGAAEFEDALLAIVRAAEALRVLKRRVGHEFKPADPEVRLHSPAPGARGGANWTVLVRVPPFVTARDAREAAAAVTGGLPLAKGIRLLPLAEGQVEVHSERGRLPGQIRGSRSGSPQHRARELR